MAHLGRFLLGIALIISLVEVASKGQEAIPLLVISLLVTGLALSVAGNRAERPQS